MKSLLKLLILLIVLGLAYVTNPSEQEHQSAFNVKAQEYIESRMESRNEVELIANSILKAVTQSAILPATELMVSRRDYKLFSITTLGFGESQEKVGIGIFGYVWIPDLVFSTIERELGSALRLP